MGEPTKKYRGPFCTGHTFFPMTAVMSYTEAIQGEFRDEYKQAHGNFKRAAPGEMQNGPDFRAIIASGRRAPNAVPLAGTPTDRIMHGGRPERRGKVSSSDVGGWWDDPLFQELHDEVDRQKARPARTTRPPGQGARRAALSLPPSPRTGPSPSFPSPTLHPPPAPSRRARRPIASASRRPARSAGTGTIPSSSTPTSTPRPRASRTA